MNNGRTPPKPLAAPRTYAAATGAGIDALSMYRSSAARLPGTSTPPRISLAEALRTSDQTATPPGTKPAALPAPAETKRLSTTILPGSVRAAASAFNARLTAAQPPQLPGGAAFASSHNASLTQALRRGTGSPPAPLTTTPPRIISPTPDTSQPTATTDDASHQSPLNLEQRRRTPTRNLRDFRRPSIASMVSRPESSFAESALATAAPRAVIDTGEPLSSRLARYKAAAAASKGSGSASASQVGRLPKPPRVAGQRHAPSPTDSDGEAGPDEVITSLFSATEGDTDGHTDSVVARCDAIFARLRQQKEDYKGGCSPEDLETFISTDIPQAKMELGFALTQYERMRSQPNLKRLQQALTDIEAVLAVVRGNVAPHDQSRYLDRLLNSGPVADTSIQQEQRFATAVIHALELMTPIAQGQELDKRHFQILDTCLNEIIGNMDPAVRHGLPLITGSFERIEGGEGGADAIRVDSSEIESLVDVLQRQGGSEAMQARQTKAALKAVLTMIDGLAVKAHPLVEPPRATDVISKVNGIGVALYVKGITPAESRISLPEEAMVEVIAISESDDALARSDKIKKAATFVDSFAKAYEHYASDVVRFYAQDARRLAVADLIADKKALLDMAKKLESLAKFGESQAKIISAAKRVRDAVELLETIAENVGEEGPHGERPGLRTELEHHTLRRHQYRFRIDDVVVEVMPETTPDGRAPERRPAAALSPCARGTLIALGASLWWSLLAAAGYGIYYLAPMGHQPAPACLGGTQTVGVTVPVNPDSSTVTSVAYHDLGYYGRSTAACRGALTASFSSSDAIAAPLGVYGTNITISDALSQTPGVSLSSGANPSTATCLSLLSQLGNATTITNTPNGGQIVIFNNLTPNQVNAVAGCFDHVIQPGANITELRLAFAISADGNTFLQQAVLAKITPTPALSVSGSLSGSVTQSASTTTMTTVTPTVTGTVTTSVTLTPSPSPQSTQTPTPTITLSPTTSPSGTPTGSISATLSETGSPTPSQVVTLSRSATVSPTRTASGAPSMNISPTPSASGTASTTYTTSSTGTRTLTSSGSVTQTATVSTSSTRSSSGSATQTETVTETTTNSATQTQTVTQIATKTNTATGSQTQSITTTVTQSGVQTSSQTTTITTQPTPSPSSSRSQSQSPTLTLTPTPSVSPSTSGTHSGSATPSVSRTPSITATLSQNGTTLASASITGSMTASMTKTPSRTSSGSATQSTSLTLSPTGTPSGSGTYTTSSTGTRTLTNSGSVTQTATVSLSSTPSSSGSPTQTETVTETTSSSATQTQTVTQIVTKTNTATGSQTQSITQTVTQSGVQTSSQTTTVTTRPTPSPSSSRSQSQSPTLTLTPTPSVTPSTSGTHSGSATPSVSRTPSVTATLSQNGTTLASASITGSMTASMSKTPSRTSSGSLTQSPSLTLSPTGTSTATLTPSGSGTATLTNTASQTMTATLTPSPTGSGTPTMTLSTTPTNSRTPSVTATVTSTPSTSITATATGSPSPSMSITVSTTRSGTGTPTTTITPSPTGSASASCTRSLTVTPSQTHSVTITTTPSGSRTATVTATATNTVTGTMTLTPTQTGSITVSPSGTPSFTASPSPTSSATSTGTPSATGTARFELQPAGGTSLSCLINPCTLFPSTGGGTVLSNWFPITALNVTMTPPGSYAPATTTGWILSGDVYTPTSGLPVANQAILNTILARIKLASDSGGQATVTATTSKGVSSLQFSVNGGRLLLEKVTSTDTAFTLRDGRLKKATPAHAHAFLRGAAALPQQKQQNKRTGPR